MKTFTIHFSPVGIVGTLAVLAGAAASPLIVSACVHTARGFWSIAGELTVVVVVGGIVWGVKRRVLRLRGSVKTHSTRQADTSGA